MFFHQIVCWLPLIFTLMDIKMIYWTYSAKIFMLQCFYVWKYYIPPDSFAKSHALEAKKSNGKIKYIKLPQVYFIKKKLRYIKFCVAREVLIYYDRSVRMRRWHIEILSGGIALSHEGSQPVLADTCQIPDQWISGSGIPLCIYDRSLSPGGI